MAFGRKRRPARRRRPLRALLLLAVLLAVGAWAYSEFFYTPVIFGLRDDFVHAVPNQAVPEGLTSLSAEECGTCHAEIYAEWKTSIHAHAWKDPYFQAYWKHDDNIWICLNCHTPLENQQPERILDLERGKVQRPVKAPNPAFDAELREEGITCSGCHVRDGIIYGPYDDSDAPHPTAYDPKYRTTEICYWCHQVPSGPLQFYNGGPCATFFEFEDGPYAKRGYTCQSCHMPAATRPAAVGGPVRDTRRHLWRGGHFPAMVKQALQVRLAGPENGWTPGDKVTFRLTLTNGGAGHKIPTGDPDRYFLIRFTERDDHGRVIRERTRKITRWIVWRPIIVELYENRIPPLESRDYTHAVTTRRGHTLTATVSYHILTARQKDKLIDRYALPPDTMDHFTVYERTVDLGRGRLEPEVAVTDTGRCLPAGHPA
jgi:hypothetical protein